MNPTRTMNFLPATRMITLRSLLLTALFSISLLLFLGLVNGLFYYSRSSRAESALDSFDKNPNVIIHSKNVHSSKVHGHSTILK